MLCSEGSNDDHEISNLLSQPHFDPNTYDEVGLLFAN